MITRKRIPSGWAVQARRYAATVRQRAEEAHARAKAAHFEDSTISGPVAGAAPARESCGVRPAATPAPGRN